MNPGWISAVIVALLQFGSIVWWAATTNADRRHARERDEKHEAELTVMRACLASMQELLSKHNTRIALVEDRLPGRANARR